MDYQTWQTGSLADCSQMAADLQGVYWFCAYLILVLHIRGAMSMSDDSHVVLGVTFRSWMGG